MKLNNVYSLKEIAGEKVIIHQGTQGVDMTKIISFNPTAEFLWHTFANKNFSLEEVIDALMQEYGVDRPLAETDARQWADQFKNLNLILD